MMPVSLRDVVEVVTRLSSQHRLYGRKSRAADRSRRKAGVRIRIVRRVDARIRDGQLRLLLAQGILDRRINWSGMPMESLFSMTEAIGT